jgi:hypothetical protein
MRSSPRWLVMLLVLLVAPSAAMAQEVEVLRRELETMREQFESVRRQYERRMQELGDRLRTLETQPATPPASSPPPVSGSPPATPPPARAAAEPPSLIDLARPRQPFALVHAGGLLFDIGVSGDFIADFTSTTRERRRDGTFEGRENRLFPREVSLGLFGRVDPYASAVVRITAGEEAPGDRGRAAEIAVLLEEANATLFTLPLDTTARFGLMRPRFGTLNVVHQDDLPQVDRPDVLKRFFGEEELNGEKGLEAMWLLPTPFYEELSVVVTGKTSDDHRNTVASLGLKYKWAPITGYGFPVLTLAGELLYGTRRVSDPDGVRGDRRFERWGAYVYGQYDWTRRWAAGLRYDWTELPTGTGHDWALSPYLQFKPSEFLRFRVQYKHTRGTGAIERDADEVFLQGSFILGAHPTERF